jgi:type I restriction enzyme M protein
LPTGYTVDSADRRLPDLADIEADSMMLMKAAACGFYNTSRLDFPKLLQDPDNVAANLVGSQHGFSENVRDIMERFRFESQITRLDSANLLFLGAARRLRAAWSD